MAVILRGWALAEEGQGEEGIARMRQGLADLRATGAGLWRPSFLALLAEAHGRAGRLEDGLGALDEALAMASRTASVPTRRSCTVSGASCCSRAGRRTSREAEACFREALEVARRAGGEVPRAPRRDLAGAPLRRSGRCTEAHDVLAPVHGWFTEGFNTADLKEAKTLLEELGSTLATSAVRHRRTV